MVLSRKQRKICETKLVLDNAEIQPEETITYLGVTLDNQLKWKEHVKKLRGKCFAGLTKLRRISSDLPPVVKKKLLLCTDPATHRHIVVWCGTTYQLSRRERWRPYRMVG